MSGADYHAVRGGSNKKMFVNEMLECAAIPITAIEQLCVALFITLFKIVLAFIA